MLRWIRRIIVLLLLGGACGGGWWWYTRRSEVPNSTYRTVPLKRGELVATIGATGTVEPVELVDVGAQVAGKLNEFGKDLNGKTVDFGSRVEEGMLLALIDDSLPKLDVAAARAQLSQSSAGVMRAEADVTVSKAKLAQASRDWDRAQKLGPSDALAQNAYDNYRSAFEVAQAILGLNEASLAQAKGLMEQAQVSLDRATRNKGYCTITSPVKGVIIDRRVNIGQTVVARLNAPSLFLIAKDLTRLRVSVAVNEADIGNIYAGQAVTFTVDAYRNRSFSGVVEQVRLNASMTQNVVTYPVVVSTDNNDGLLLPYLTANLKFEVSRKQGVLLVPNAALRWTPQMIQVAPDVRAAIAGRRTEDTSGAGRGSSTQPSSRPSQASTRPSGRSGEYRPGTVWTVDGPYVRPVAVVAGLTDGTMTEIRTEDLDEGSPIVVAEERVAAAASGTSNPFAQPSFNWRGGRGTQSSGTQSSGAGGGGAKR